MKKRRAPTGSLLLERIEWTAALVVTGLVVAVHVSLLLSAGALWRDEVNVVNVAGAASLGRMWAALEFEAFPALWPLGVRLWTLAGLGESDLALRTAGFVMGLGVVGTLWWHARVLTGSVPLLSLVLLALSPTVIRWGDALRAFGLGTALILVTAALTWQALQRPTRSRIIAVAIVAGLAAHTLYHNAMLVFALGAGAAAVGALRRDGRIVVAVGAIGTLCALSLLLYRGPLGAALAWNMVLKAPVDVPVILGTLWDAMSAAGRSAGWLWLLSAVAALGACAARLVGGGPRQGAPERERAVFLLVSACVAAVGYLVFLLVLGYPPRAWYYIPVMGLLAATFDASIGLAAGSIAHGRTLRLAVVLLAAVLVARPAWSTSLPRQTNVNLIAHRLETLAGKDDLIVVSPWFFGITFLRYHRGPAPWVTVPEIGDLRLHRFDLMKARMAETAPLAPLLDRMGHTLRAGHRVWLLGRFPFLEPGQQVEVLGPAPAGGAGWSAGRYIGVWGTQTAAFVQRHAGSLNLVPVPAGRPINQLEDAQLIEARGWR